MRPRFHPRSQSGLRGEELSRLRAESLPVGLDTQKGDEILRRIEHHRHRPALLAEQTKLPRFLLDPIAQPGAGSCGPLNGCDPLAYRFKILEDFARAKRR